MKKADLKELIKQSMLEISPRGESGEMTPEEEKMVADYEEGEANNHALDSENSLEESTEGIPNDIKWEVEEEFDWVDPPYTKDAMLTGYSKTTGLEYRAKGYVSNLGDIEWVDYDDIETIEPIQELIKRTDAIVESLSKKKMLKEADFSQANFDDLYQVVKNIAHVNGTGTKSAAMDAIKFIAEQFDLAVDFRDF